MQLRKCWARGLDYGTQIFKLNIAGQASAFKSFEGKLRQGAGFWLGFCLICTVWGRSRHLAPPPPPTCMELALNLGFTSQCTPGLLSHSACCRLGGGEGGGCSATAGGLSRQGVQLSLGEGSSIWGQASYRQDAEPWELKPCFWATLANEAGDGGVELSRHRGQTWERRRKRARQIEIALCLCVAVI